VCFGQYTVAAGRSQADQNWSTEFAVSLIEAVHLWILPSYAAFRLLGFASRFSCPIVAASREHLQYNEDCATPSVVGPPLTAAVIRCLRDPSVFPRQTVFVHISKPRIMQVTARILFAGGVARDSQGSMTGPRLICPLDAESGALGGEPTLAYRLWHILEQQSGGLSLERLEAELGPTNGCGSATDVLTSSKYFIETGAQSSLQLLPHST